MTQADVTQVLNSYIADNKLCIVVNSQFLGHDIDSNRIKLLTVKFQTPLDVYYSFALQNETFMLDVNSTGFSSKLPFKITGVYYGNSNDYNDAMTKLKHYDYFKWTEINANHELFPSSTRTDEIEYLTIIYSNTKGIYTVSCAENEKICCSTDGTYLYMKSNADHCCILPDVLRLQCNSNMDCTWAGALYAATRYMNEDITYEQLMGISGACYRIAFTEIWDWSSVDALAAFDYAEIAYKALGYELIWADRIEKSSRKNERERIMLDINNGKPPIAINLRIAV
jgi:hypothetical protein